MSDIKKESDDIIEGYFNDMSKFNMKEFLNHIRNKSKIEWCKYFMFFTHKLHKKDFMSDLVLYHITSEMGHRTKDIIEDNKHLMKEFIEELKKEDLLFMQYGIQSLMPIRYYFKEDVQEIVSYFNNIVDSDNSLTDDQKKRKRFRLSGI